MLVIAITHEIGISKDLFFIRVIHFSSCAVNDQHKP